MKSRFVLSLVAALVATAISSRVDAQRSALRPGTRVLLDAHNAYPDNGRWTDRLDRALSTGLPIAIEQDLVWLRDPRTGAGRSVLSHGESITGDEPTLDLYFFARIRPLVERALQSGDRSEWPVITLNLDFKTDEPEHHRAVWDLLGRYESWLVTATRTASPADIQPLRPGPVLVLTGAADAPEQAFHDPVPVGRRLRLFGAVHTSADGLPGPKTNFRRWVNYPWSAVEIAQQPEAGTFTANEAEWLQTLVREAHARDLWIRFYTLDGHDPLDVSNGWTAGYNFGSLEAAEVRWRAAVDAGVDFIAVDQYELFAERRRRDDNSRVVTVEGTLTRAQYEQFVEHAFDVPAGVSQLEIDLSYDDRERTVIDLGVRGPAAFRGWSGSGPQRIHIGTYSASYGYAPGPLETGRWAVVLGVPNIRPGVTAAYRVDVRFTDTTRQWPVLRSGGRWYAGDLHAHSGHSDGRATDDAGVRIKVPPHHVFDAAARAGLDFIALTDHNTPSHWLDVDRLQPSYRGLLLLHAREITTYRGHMNALGERRFVDFRLRPDRTVARLANELTAAGAWLSMNHPTRPDDERCMGCGWNDRDRDTITQLQGVEVVNGDAAEDPLAGWRFWADRLNERHRLVAIGGSDEHTPDDVVDQRLGTPTTVIYAENLSEQALLEGLRSGRVYVRTRGARGPHVELTAARGDVPFHMGAMLDAGPMSLTVATSDAEGQRLEWFRKGRMISSAVIGRDGLASLAIEAIAGDWFSVILHDAAGPTALSNAIYVR